MQINTIMPGRRGMLNPVSCSTAQHTALRRSEAPYGAELKARAPIAMKKCLSHSKRAAFPGHTGETLSCSFLPRRQARFEEIVFGHECYFGAVF